MAEWVCFGCQEVRCGVMVARTGLDRLEILLCDYCIHELPASVRIMARPPDEAWRRRRLDKIRDAEIGRTEKLAREIL
jgi:hypothetical protein